MLRHFGGIHPKRGVSKIIQYTSETAFTPIAVNSSGAKTTYSQDSYNIIGTGIINGKFDTALIKIKGIFPTVSIDTQEEYYANRATVMMEVANNGDFMISAFDPNNGNKFKAMKFTYDEAADSYDITTENLKDLEDVKYIFKMDPNTKITNLNTTRFVPIIGRNTNQSYISFSGMGVTMVSGAVMRFSTSSFGSAGSNSNTDFSGTDYGFYLYQEMSDSSALVEFEQRVEAVEAQMEQLTEDIDKFSSDSANHYVSR